MNAKKVILAVFLVLLAASLSIAMPPRERVKEPVWITNARKAGMDSPKDGLIQQLQSKDASTKISGSRSYPVVIGYFTDTASTYTRDTIQLRLFNTGTNVMSVNNYYRDMSYNAMSCSGSVAAWVNSGHTMNYFGNGSNGLNTADTIQSAYGFIKHTLVACDAAVDFSVPAYDQNGDGYVDVLWVVHAGRGGEEEPDTLGNWIWSHSWQLIYWKSGTGKVFTTNDPRPGYAGQYMKIDKYIIMPEKTLYANGVADVDLIGCGVFCHEFGHALGLPDLYDTGGVDSISGEGIGKWSLMAGGSWGGNGATNARPVALDVWCRSFLGWSHPALVTTNNQYTVNSIMAADSGSSYKLARLGSDTTKQYWLVENRHELGMGPVSSVRWDSLLPSASPGGLAIYHIDTTYTSGTYFANNTVNVNSTNGTSRNRPYGVCLEETDDTTAGYLSELWYGTNGGDTADIWTSLTQASFDSSGTDYPVTYLNGTTPTTGGSHTLVAVRAIPAASAAMTCSMFVEVLTGVEGQPQAGLIPEAFALSNSYPNPAKGQITFSYQLPKASQATLEIYNMLGQRVQKFDLGHQPAGTHSLSWNSSQAVQGVYFYRLQAGDYSSTKKMMLVK